MKIQLKRGNAILEKDGEVWYSFIEKDINTQMLSCNGYDYLTSKYILAIPITGDFACPQIIPISGINQIYFFGDMIKEVEKDNKIKIEDFVIPFIGGISGMKMTDWYPRLCGLNKKYAYEYRDEMIKYFTEILTPRPKK